MPAVSMDSRTAGVDAPQNKLHKLTGTLDAIGSNIADMSNCKEYSITKKDSILFLLIDKNDFGEIECLCVKRCLLGLGSVNGRVSGIERCLMTN